MDTTVKIWPTPPLRRRDKIPNYKTQAELKKEQDHKEVEETNPETKNKN